MSAPAIDSATQPTATPPRRRRWWLWILGAVVAVLLVSAIGFVIWANNAAPPMAQALASLQGDDKVGVIEGKWIIFQPLAITRETGFIFYPGGRVDRAPTRRKPRPSPSAATRWSSCPCRSTWPSLARVVPRR